MDFVCSFVSKCGNRRGGTSWLATAEPQTKSRGPLIHDQCGYTMLWSASAVKDYAVTTQMRRWNFITAIALDDSPVLFRHQHGCMFASLNDTQPQLDRSASTWNSTYTPLSLLLFQALHGCP